MHMPQDSNAMQFAFLEIKYISIKDIRRHYCHLSRIAKIQIILIKVNIKITIQVGQLFFQEKVKIAHNQLYIDYICYGSTNA